MRKIILILICILLAFSRFSQTTDSIPAKETVNHYNETVKVYGNVSGGFWLQTSFLTLLNVDGNYPNYTLTIMIKDTDRKKFTYAPETFLKGK